MEISGSDYLKGNIFTGLVDASRLLRQHQFSHLSLKSEIHVFIIIPLSYINIQREVNVISVFSSLSTLQLALVPKECSLYYCHHQSLKLTLALKLALALVKFNCGFDFGFGFCYGISVGGDNVIEI